MTTPPNGIVSIKQFLYMNVNAQFLSYSRKVTILLHMKVIKIHTIIVYKRADSICHLYESYSKLSE